MPDSSLKIAIAGLGVVGSEVAKLIQEKAGLLADRSGRDIKLVMVSARDSNKDRGFNLDGVEWTADVLALAKSSDVDLVIEAIGGSEGIAKELVECSLNNGKHVVTANKALLAEHGLQLAQIAEDNNVTLAYEAAIAGGIPIVKALREGLAANNIDRVIGILNGTSNFILTYMQDESVGFDDALAEASKLGYAEADPSFDVDGVDAAHKLSILSALAFGCKPSFQDIHIEGIRNIAKQDKEFAAELGYSIKLLAISERMTDGAILQRVHACMLNSSSPIGVDGVFNAVVVEGDSVGRSTLEGRGAGGGPTASSVVADIMDIAREVKYPVYNIPSDKLLDSNFAPITELKTGYYLRLSVFDKPGVLADVTRIFAENSISMQSVLQKSNQPNNAVQLVLTTHKSKESDMQKAISQIEALNTVSGKVNLIRIESFDD